MQATRFRISTTSGIIALTMSLLLGVDGAHAACSPADRAYAVEGRQVLDGMRAVHAPGAGDVAQVVQRARRRCGDTRFAYAVAAATSKLGPPEAAARAYVAGLDLRGAVDGSGVPVWRLDVPRGIERISSAGTAAGQAELRRRMLPAASGMSALTWTNDPTEPRWTARLQTDVAAALDFTGTPLDRRLAARTIAAFAVGTRSQVVAGTPIAEALRDSTTLARAAHRSGSTPALRAAHLIGRLVHRRLVAAPVAGWSMTDGRWSTLAQHRTLVRDGRRLAQLVPSRSGASAVDRMRLQLITPPTATLVRLPRSAFYPQPIDGAFDEQAVHFAVDKPSTVRLIVYGLRGEIVRVVERSAEPGAVQISWNGADAGGGMQPAGDYRYRLDLVDLARNSRVVAGPGTFTIARDDTPPRPGDARATWRSSSGAGRVIARWSVDEVHSPAVQTQLTLARGTWRRTFVLHGSATQATIRKPLVLGRGTYTATMTWLDGSGNAASRNAGSFTVQ